MGLRGIDESMFPEVVGEFQEPTAIDTDGSKTEGLVGIGIFLDEKNCLKFHFKR
jgi:hypothetical protein